MERTYRIEDEAFQALGIQEQEFLKKLDVGYSYQLAKKMERFKSNETLGYRTAGSPAEYETGEMLFQEMNRIGLSGVVKDEIRLDCWEFKKARMQFADQDGAEHTFELAGYQTDFQTGGPKEYRLVYAGRATERELAGLDVRGKLVLADINQRDEWWISYPVYQVYLKGAAALIAVQDSGFGEIHDTSLNAQDIGGPVQAAAFSISQADAWLLKEACRRKGELTVIFDADSKVTRDGVSYNILGKIPGKNPESMILLSAHYDSYFQGFQDDNAAVSMMFGIAKALLESGYTPDKTLLFCAMAAEEWGVVNSKYDWSAGAFQEFFTVHPEWKGKVFANLNFELPAHAHGKRDEIRSVYEYVSFLKEFAKTVPALPEAYPEGLGVVYPIETWSDDFSAAIAGIPSMVNDFSDSSFMETHYHSQFDNDAYYQEDVYYYHHMLYGMLLMAFDRTAVVPLDFTLQLKSLAKTLNTGLARQAGIPTGAFLQEIDEAAKAAGELYRNVKSINDAAALRRKSGQGVPYENKEKEPVRKTEMESVRKMDMVPARKTDMELEWKTDRKLAGLQKDMLSLFAYLQDSLVRLNWFDDVVFPHTYVQYNLLKGNMALDWLRQEEAVKALEAIYEIDNNRYAFLFDREVFDYFTDYVLKQDSARLQWGAGRVMGHEHLFGVIRSLSEKLKWEDGGYEEEIHVLSRVQENQERLLYDAVMQEWEAVKETKARLLRMLEYI